MRRPSFVIEVIQIIPSLKSNMRGAITSTVEIIQVNVLALSDIVQLFITGMLRRRSCQAFFISTILDSDV
jgi:hypothetical protein